MFNLKPFKIKKVTTTYGGGNTSVSYNVYKRFLFVFWAIARKKDVQQKRVFLIDILLYITVLLRKLNKELKIGKTNSLLLTKKLKF